MKRKIWIILALVALIVALGCGAALADQSGTLTSTISWTLTDDGALTITGSGAMPDYNPRANPSPFKSSMNVRSVVIGSGITQIGNDTFVGCANTLKSVSLPASLYSIGREAFLNCSKLTAITLPEGLQYIDRYAFGRTGLTSVVIPASVTNIGEYSFYECASLTDAYIMNSGAAFGTKAFGNLSSSFVLHGWAGSTAQTCASENSLSFSPALSGSCGDNVTWSYSNGTLTISGTGPMWDYMNGNPAAPFYNNNGIHTATVEYGVTSIGNFVFYHCTNLASVTIPDSVTSIGIGAFSGTGLISVTIPNSVTSIGASLFGSCSSLTSVTISNKVTAIPQYAFQWCTALDHVTIPNSVTHIDFNAFENCGLKSITIPDSVATIGTEAFYRCSRLENITLPSSMTDISYGLFYECSSLTSVTIPEGVITIGSTAFAYCSKLKSVTIPLSATKIQSSAFVGCPSLTSATLYNPNTTIDNNGNFEPSANFKLRGWDPSTTKTYAEANGISFESLGSLTGTCGYFAYMGFDPVTGGLTIMGQGNIISAPWSSYREWIQSVTIHDGITGIGNDSFRGCTNLTSVSIANSVTSIGTAAFEDCTGLTGITLPNSLSSIGIGAFYGCSGLMGITLPDGLTEIGSNAFEGCTGLTEITIPYSVTSVGASAFCECASLRRISFLNPATVIGGSVHDVFVGCTDENFTMIGYLGSTAQRYADAAGHNFAVFLIQMSAPDFLIPPQTIRIEPEAFSGVQMTVVYIPDSVTFLGIRAFENCTKLKEIRIPKSITSIPDNVFSGIDKSQLIIFGTPGSAAQTFANSQGYRFAAE